MIPKYNSDFHVTLVRASKFNIHFGLRNKLLMSTYFLSAFDSYAPNLLPVITYAYNVV